MHSRHVLLVNDHPAWSGIGRYVRELHLALRAQPPTDLTVDLLLQNMPGRADPSDWCSPLDDAPASHVSVQPRPRWADRNGFGLSYLINSHLRFPRRIPNGYDLYHISSQMMGASIGHAAPAVVTVHDLIAFRLAANQPPVSTWLRRRHFRPLRRASGLAFTSEFSRRDFLTRFDYPEHRTTVIHHGVSDAFGPRDRAASRNALQLPHDRPVLLHVGSEERRKNVETLLEAVAVLVKERPDLLLLRIGGGSSRSRRLIARLRLERHVRYVPGISDSQLAACYSAADLFVFPSYFEGFGLPVLEAMKAGCPVVAARATSLPEITGEAALLFEAMDVAALARTVGSLLDDASQREELRRRGMARAAGFTWERAARQTLEAYRRVLDST